jgi:hypothetical protein
LIGIGAGVTHRPLPHHRAYGSVHDGSSWLRFHLIDQRRKSQRFKVCIGKPNRESFGPREIPGSKTTARRVTGQAWTNTQCQQCFQATAWCFPLPPQSRSKSQTDPASEVNQHFWRFAEAEIAFANPAYTEPVRLSDPNRDEKSSVTCILVRHSQDAGTECGILNHCVGSAERRRRRYRLSVGPCISVVL